MLQVAFGGYYLINGAINYFDDSPVYYEPGFNMMVPLEMEVPLCDRIYILITKRHDDTGENFGVLTASDLEISVNDATNDEPIPASIYDNTIHSDWDENPSIYLPVVAYIDNAISLSEAAIRVRTLDCYIRDTTDNSFITFRLIVSDENKYFSYIPITVSRLSNRPFYSALGRSSLIRVDNSSDLYILISPYAYLYEVSNSEKYDFSYPLDSIYYKRQRTYNDEDFSFSIGTVSDSFINDNISLINIPGYGKVAAVHIDRYIYRKLVEKEGTSSFYINIEGRLSGISDSFLITLSR